MAKVVKHGIVAFVVIVVLAAVYAFVVLRPVLSTRTIDEPMPLTDCRLISGPVGPEDFAYLPAAHGLIVSSADKRAPDDTLGLLYWLDLSVPVDEQVAVPLDIEYPDRFRPHGLSLRSSDGGHVLYVISHPLEDDRRHTIEVFAISTADGKPHLHHLEALADPLLVSPNDLAALPDGSLFIANDGVDLAGGTTGMLLDKLLHRARAPLLYFDGQRFIDMNTNVIVSAGIAAATEGDRQILYRSDLDFAVDRFEVVHEPDGSVELQLLSRYELESAPDNVLVDERGDVYVTGHYALGLLLDHSKDETVLAPTQVFRLLPSGEHELVFSDKGGLISAGSVATVVDGRLLIGQPYGEGILTCAFDG